MGAEELIQAYIQRVSGMVTLPSSVLEDVGQLLNAIGYQWVDGDDWLLGFLTKQIEQEIYNGCNISTVPEGLYYVATNLIVSAFLQSKRAKGLLNADVLTLEHMGLKQLQEGDTNMVFDTAHSPEQKLDLFLATLENGRNQFVTFRKLKW